MPAGQGGRRQKSGGGVFATVLFGRIYVSGCPSASSPSSTSPRPRVGDPAMAALNAAAFDPGDLELAIAGLDDVDVGDWRAHTEYSQGYDDDDPAVANFWSFVAGLPDEKRAKLLQFVTGTSRLPAGGFANLQGRDGVTKGFELRRRPGGDKAFPVAHTCFNRLDLPAYSDVAVLARILSAILEGDVLGFSGD